VKQWQRYLAELFGTFILVFGGTTTLIEASKLGAGGIQFIVPFGFGLALLAGLYAFAEVSGGHFNPAVSLGLFLDRRLTFEDLLGYWIFQFAGAIMASLLMLIPFNHDLVKSTANVAHGNGASIFMEIAFTALCQRFQRDPVAGTGRVARLRRRHRLCRWRQPRTSAHAGGDRDSARRLAARRRLGAGAFGSTAGSGTNTR